MDRLLNNKICILILLLSNTLSCNLDDGNTLPIPQTTLADNILADPELSSLAAALERANFLATFQGSTKYTILAPTNSAFGNFLSAKGYASLNDVPLTDLTQLLLNHVILGQVDSTPLVNLQRNYLQTLADGPDAGSKLSLYFDAVNGVIFNGTATVTQADLIAANGIMHKVNAVIELPTIVTFVVNDINFETLETALDLAAPFSDIPDALEEGGPYTLFAPTEHAFENLLATNTDWDMISDLDEEFLAEVIAHHVVNGNFRTADISFGSMLTTLEGDEITFQNIDGNLEITDGSGNEGSIVGIQDIQASNGVLHGLINNVLLPDLTN